MADAALQLAQIQTAFALGDAELRRLFGDTRDADKIAVVSAIAQLLSEKVDAEAIPAIARRPSQAYHGETMLDWIAADRHRQLLDLTRRSFDWTSSS